MFAQTSKKLTFLFAMMFIIFLVALDTANYFLLSSIVYRDYEKEIRLLVDAETKEHGQKLLRLSEESRPQSDWRKEARKKREHTGKEHKEKEKEKEKENRLMKPQLQPFYYVLDSQGNWVEGNAEDSQLDELILHDISGWIPHGEEIRFQSYKLDDHPFELILAARPVYRGDTYLGSVYAGADITLQKNLLRQVMTTLIAISLIFLLVSIILGYAMAKRAMKPIMQSFARQQQFTADASHELRTPLSVMQSSIEVIEAESEEQLSPFSKQVLADMKDEVKRMAGLVGNLLTLARADGVDDLLHYSVFAVAQELGQVLRTFQTIAVAKDLQLSLQADPDQWVRADAERLRQLLVILLDNAVQYTPNGGSITVIAERKGSTLLLQVIDTGIGIPKERQSDIFERFTRVDPSRSRLQGNVGLGLAIAKWIAEAHEGRIEVRSEPGKGSTFSVHLPIICPAPDEPS